MDASRLDAAALALAVGTQPARCAALLKATVRTWPVLPLAESLALLAQHGRLGPDVSASPTYWRFAATRVLTRANAARHTLLWPAHPSYPPLLGTIVDPPLGLWMTGHLDVLASPAVAIVGSRRASGSGREVAWQLAADLAAAGLVVASGFALGIDAAAHRGALSRGRTLAVLGCGLDQSYPSGHATLRQEIEAAGLLVTEFPPGSPPRAHHFPLRNRILSGLCRAVVVVQAAERSGSLITARLAMEQGRDVMAVPGDVRAGTNAGGHALLRDGARLVERAADVLDELGWYTAARPSGPPDAPAAVPLLGLLASESDGRALDDLVEETGRNPTELLAGLLDLELAGAVRRDGAGRFLPAERKW